jgi:hypothetical protein
MEKPRRAKSGLWIIESGKITNDFKKIIFGDLHPLPIEVFPSITWEDEPIEVELVKKTNKNFYTDEVNNILIDLGYSPCQNKEEMDDILKENNIKIKIFKTEEVLPNSAKIPNSYMYFATCGEDDFSEDFTEYITFCEAYNAAILESLSYLWLTKNRKNEKQ